MGNTKSTGRRSRSPHTAPGSGGSNTGGSSGGDRHNRPPRGSPLQPQEGQPQQQQQQQHTPRGHHGGQSQQPPNAPQVPPAQAGSGGPRGSSNNRNSGQQRGSPLQPQEGQPQQQQQQHTPRGHHGGQPQQPRHPAQQPPNAPQGPPPQAGSGGPRGPSNNRNSGQQQPNQPLPSHHHQHRPLAGGGNPPRGPPPPGGVYPPGPPVPPFYQHPPGQHPPFRYPHNGPHGRRGPGARGPPGPISYVVPPQSAVLPEHSESETVRNHANLLKSSLGIASIGEGLYTLNFTVDTSAPSEVTIYFAAVEKADPDTPNSGGAMFTPQNAQLPNHIVKAGSVPEQSAYKFTSPSDQPFDVRRYAKYLTYNGKQKPANYPIVIVLQYEIPARAGAAASEEPTTEGNQIGKQITYAEIETITTTEGVTHKIKPVRQRLQIGGNLYEVEDIYGAEAHTVMEGTVVEGFAEEVEVEGDECVICMSEEKDTVVMPCRHLCLCASCAEALRRQSNKCPICRTVIERLMTKRKEIDQL